jgi:hypothetical protein
MVTIDTIAYLSQKKNAQISRELGKDINWQFILKQMQKVKHKKLFKLTNTEKQNNEKSLYTHQIGKS